MVLALGLSACGAGVPPELSNLSLSSGRAQLGTEVFLRADLFDAEGDVDEGQLIAGMQSLDDPSVDVSATAPVLGFEPGQTQGEVIVGLRLVGAVSPGGYTVWMQAEDNQGARSEPQRARLTLSR